jgi:F-type H+-transporting ATPase subunit c
MRKFLTFSLIALAATTAAFAEGTAATGAFNSLFDTKFIAFIGVAIAAAACSTAQGKALMAAFEGMARNPQAAEKISGSLVLGLAFIEVMMLLTFLLVFLVK